MERKVDVEMEESVDVQLEDSLLTDESPAATRASTSGSATGGGLAGTAASLDTTTGSRPVNRTGKSWTRQPRTPELRPARCRMARLALVGLSTPPPRRRGAWHRWGTQADLPWATDDAISAPPFPLLRSHVVHSSLGLEVHDGQLSCNLLVKRELLVRKTTIQVCLRLSQCLLVLLVLPYGHNDVVDGCVAVLPDGAVVVGAQRSGGNTNRPCGHVAWP